MDLKETILKMKESSPENFDILIEMMCRKADKGLLENITSNDIRNTVNLIEHASNDSVIDESFTLELAEITDAENYYNSYIEESVDNYLESQDIDTLEDILLYEYSLNLLGEEQLQQLLEADTTSTGATTAKVAGVAAAGAGTALLVNKGVTDYKNYKLIKNAMNAKNAAIAASGSTTAKQATFAGTKAALKAQGKLHKSWIPGAIEGIKKGASAVAASPVTHGVLAGLGVAAAGYGLYKLLKFIKKKRAEKKALKESSDWIYDLSESTIQSILGIYSLISEESYDDINNDIINEQCFDYLDKLPVNETLTEAVTYIDNAGNLKTKSAVDYVKDMHEYHTETQIKKYEKKNKKFIIDYKLLDEMIDEAEMEDAILLNEKSDQIFNAKHDPDEYVAKKNIKQSLRTGEYTEKSKDTVRRTLEKTDDDEELSNIKSEIHSEMSKEKVDRKKVKDLYRKYKKAYKSKKGKIKKSVKDDQKLEKIENKKVKNLYEMSLEEALNE